MKKLVIAMVAIAMGVAAHAATATWGATSVMVAGSQISTASVGCMHAYLINADVWSDGEAAMTALLGGSTDGVLADTASIAQGTKTDRVKFSVDGGTIAGTWKEGDTLNSFMLIVDATSAAGAANYMELADQNVTTTFSTSLEAGPSFSASGAAWTAVPEPTSGLLLLIGMAGLALRRRRA